MGRNSGGVVNISSGSAIGGAIGAAVKSSRAIHTIKDKKNYKAAFLVFMPLWA